MSEPDNAQTKTVKMVKVTNTPDECCVIIGKKPDDVNAKFFGSSWWLPFFWPMPYHYQWYYYY